MLYPKDCPDMIYLMPCPKSPHGADVDPTGEYIVGGGKLSTVIPVFSFKKMQAAIAAKDFIGEVDGLPIFKYESVIGRRSSEAGSGTIAY